MIEAALILAAIALVALWRWMANLLKARGFRDRARRWLELYELARDDDEARML